jgi:hypothetical protein
MMEYNGTSEIPRYVCLAVPLTLLPVEHNRSCTAKQCIAKDCYLKSLGRSRMKDALAAQFAAPPQQSPLESACERTLPALGNESTNTLVLCVSKHSRIDYLLNYLLGR